MMNIQLFQRSQWNHLAQEERIEAALNLSRHLHSSFQLVDVRQYQMGDQQNWVALFDHSGTAFALIPGGEAVLGYDDSQTFPATPLQLDSWQGTVEEWGAKGTLDQHICHVTTPLRTVSFAPFLLEVSAVQLGLTPVEGCPGRYRIKTINHAEAREAAARQGFRLPTSDEWEYACSAGSRTLFRWGNDYAANCLPGGGNRAYECEDYFHRQPNAFGLHIAENPYHYEFVSDPDRMRGDGGSAICGGLGYFLSWLTLASAYVGSRCSESGTYSGFLRRALSLCPTPDSVI